MINITSLLENIQVNSVNRVDHEYDRDLMETVSITDVIPMMDNIIAETATEFTYDMLTLDESLVESALSSNFDNMIEGVGETIKEKAKAALEKIIQAVKNIVMKIKNWADRTFKMSERWAKKAKESLKKVSNDRTTKLLHTYNEQWILVDLSNDAQNIGLFGLNDVINAADIDKQREDPESILSIDEQKRVVIHHIGKKLNIKVDSLDSSKIKEALDAKTYEKDKDTVTYINASGAQQLVAIIEKSANRVKDIIKSYDEVIKRLETVKTTLMASRWYVPKKLKKEGHDKDYVKMATTEIKASIGVIDITMRAVNTIRSYQVKTINMMLKEYTTAVNNLIKGETDSGKVDTTKKSDTEPEVVDAEVVDDPRKSSNSKSTSDVIDAEYEDVK